MMTAGSRIQRSEVADKVLSLVGELLMLQDFDSRKVDFDQEDFLTALGANSIDALELIMTVEERFDVHFRDEEINFNTVRTVNHFVQCICNKIEAR